MKQTIHLGFEVGSGAPVAVPLAHMIVTGQTQAGKTTALEALVQRSAVRALAFRTKRGEGAFETSGARVLPYFRERADWRFVSAILEASIGERMKFERSWIMRATKGAKTLTDVRRNVRELGAKAKGGMSADMFMMLGEYLDGVIPELDRVTFASKVDLRPGANVVDLCDLSVNVQGLVISSMLQWVHDRERGVVAVLPEAWKFIPQGRNSPVRMAAISYAREGGTLGNLIWLDSQDLAGAEKEVVRAASVYLLGVQREANEIKRTLDHIPAGVKKPKAAELATLKLGQFFACWGEHVVRTYVQPAWLNEHEAKMVATGKMTPEQAALAKGPLPTELVLRDRSFPPLTDEERERSIEIEIQQEDEMKPEEMKQLASMIGEAVGDRVDTLGDVVRSHVDRLIDVGKKGRPTPSLVMGPEDTVRKLSGEKVAEAEAAHGLEVGAEEALYQRFVARLRKEPKLLSIALTKPSLDLVVEEQKIQADGSSLRGRVGRLIASGFFDAGKRNSDVTAEFKRTGFESHASNNLRELRSLAEIGFFTIEEGDRFKAVADMKVNVVRK